MKLLFAALSLALVATPALASKKTKVVEPLPAELIGHAVVVATTVTIGDTAQANYAKLEAKAAAKAPDAAAPTPPAPAPAPGTAAQADAAAVPADRYAAMPFTDVLPLVIADVTRQWGLTSGRAVKLAVTIDTIRTASAGMTMLLGGTDELAGTVAVSDAASGEKLGEVYIAVLNGHAGLLGLALRGSGVREKLATAFAGQVAVQLSGSKHKPKAEA